MALRRAPVPKAALLVGEALVTDEGQLLDVLTLDVDKNPVDDLVTRPCGWPQVKLGGRVHLLSDAKKLAKRRLGNRRAVPEPWQRKKGKRKGRPKGPPQVI